MSGDAVASRPRTAPDSWQAASVWGLVGALSFLVGVQGWQLLGGRPPVGLGGRLLIAAGVWAVTTGLARASAERITRKERS